LHNGHFRKRVGNNHGNERADQVGDDDAWTCEADGHAAAEEKPDTDGAANGKHRELPLREPAA
jgi:hypothetical protein